MRVIMWSHWHPNSNGSEYWEALGEYPDLKSAEADAREEAWNRYEEPSQVEQDEDGWEDEGPEWFVEEYDPEKHDRHSIGGSFENDFQRFKEERSPTLAEYDCIDNPR